MSVSDGRGRAVRDGGLARWLARAAPRTARGELAIALVSDARMRVLNRRYRRKDDATDVLSFVPDDAFRTPHPASRNVGDLVIATGVARRQAAEAGHSYQTELRVLALHGLLHLLGYDHENPNDAGRMQRAEMRLQRKAGLHAGLIQRAAAKERLKPAATTTGRLKPAATDARKRRRRGTPVVAAGFSRPEGRSARSSS